MSLTQDAVLAIVYADVAGFPPGSVVDHIQVSGTAVDPTNSPAAQNVAPGTALVTFAALNPDAYVFTAQAFSAAGVGYGSSVSTTLTIVTKTTVSLSLPSVMTATQP